MPVREIAPSALHQQLTGRGQPPVLLDVRTPEEHALVALPDSVLVPLQEFNERLAELEALKGKPVVVYCHTGVRSFHAAAFLASRGVDATSLAGGIDRYAVEVDPSLPRY
ncbi:MAG: rhodanese-like domain-containing protein [Myxococcaceae bacterium]